MQLLNAKVLKTNNILLPKGPMRFYCIILVFIFSACSSQVKKQDDAKTKEYLKLQAKHLQKNQACMEHRQNVLEQAITEIEDAATEDDQYLFVPNEADAIYFIDAFDVSKFTLKENQLEYEMMVNSCLTGPQAGHETCDTLIPTYKYFRALIPALKNNRWSQNTVRKSIYNALSYFQYVAQSQSSLMDVILANDLLMRMSRKGLLPASHLPQAVAFKTKAEKQFEQLRKEVRKLGKKDMSCEKARTFYAQERVRVKNLSDEFRIILQKFSP
jgi:hypothetical protein